MSILDKSWHEVLRNAGFDDAVAESLIGFITWHEDEIYPKLGHEINDVLNGYEGRVIARDVISSKYHHQGLLFFDEPLSEELSNRILDTILDYEFGEVYAPQNDIHS